MGRKRNQRVSSLKVSPLAMPSSKPPKMYSEDPLTHAAWFSRADGGVPDVFTAPTERKNGKQARKIRKKEGKKRDGKEGELVQKRDGTR